MPIQVRGKRFAVVALAVFVFAAVFAVLTASLPRYGAEADGSRSYTLAPVLRGEIVQSINTVGMLSPLVTVEISSEVSGLLTEVKVDFNSVVKQGDVLATIDSSTFQQRLRQALADRQAATTGYKLASLRANRLANLLSQDLIPKQDYDEAEAILEQARATLLTRTAAVDSARHALERCTIRSPIDGIVIFKQAEVGRTVVSSFAAPTLFTIAKDLSRMRLIAPINDVDVVLARPGQSVTFTVDALAPRVFAGRLVQVRDPYLPSEKIGTQPQTVAPTFDAVIDVDNRDDALRPHLTANVSIIVNHRSDVLRIPSGALRVRLSRSVSVVDHFSSPAGPYEATVYRVTHLAGRAAPEAVRIRIGISDNLFTEVLDGLTDGDSVVTGLVATDTQTSRRGLLF